MRNQIVKSARMLATHLPTLAVTLAVTLALAQPAAAQQRDGSWEFSVGGGAMLLDGDLSDFIGSTGFADSNDPSSLVPAATAGVGYNFNNHFGFSLGAAGATGSGVAYLTPFAAATYTVDLNARTSPFVTAGTQFTRISGNDRRDHPTWGTFLGVGGRHFVSENLALRLEGRMALEHYEDLPGSTSAYNGIISLGLSYFTRGRTAPAGCPACPRAAARVDTVRVPFPRTTPPRIVLRDTLVLEGVNFAFDESTLTPVAREVLDEVARQLLESRWSGTRWEIAGHTSAMGTAEYNMKLSERRAEAVRAYLVSRGVPDRRLVARGYGQTQPLVPEVRREGDAWQNRRVELRRIP